MNPAQVARGRMLLRRLDDFDRAHPRATVAAGNEFRGLRAEVDAFEAGLPEDAGECREIAGEIGRERT